MSIDHKFQQRLIWSRNATRPDASGLHELSFLLDTVGRHWQSGVFCVQLLV